MMNVSMKGYTAVVSLLIEHGAQVDLLNDVSAQDNVNLYICKCARVYIVYDTDGEIFFRVDLQM